MSERGREPGLENLWAEFQVSGEVSLRNRLVVLYAPLVKFVAGRVRSRLPDNVQADDLISDGVVGLIEAIGRFEPDRGISFQTFAVPRIRGAIIDGLRALDPVSRSVRAKVRDLQRAQVLYEQQQGRTPGDEELADLVGLSLRELHDLYAQVSFSNQASLDGFDLADSLTTAASQTVEDRDVNESILRVVRELGERDQIVIALYYFEGLTLSEIGQVLGVSEARISQLHSRAALMLRTKMIALDTA